MMFCAGRTTRSYVFSWGAQKRRSFVLQVFSPADSCTTTSDVAAISASLSLALFVFSHCDGRGLRMRTGNLRCGLSQPSFEADPAESCVIARKQSSLAEFRPRVASVWIRDDIAVIFE